MNTQEAFEIWHKNYKEYILAFDEYRNSVTNSAKELSDGVVVIDTNSNMEYLNKIDLLEKEVMRLRRNMEEIIDKLDKQI